MSVVLSLKRVAEELEMVHDGVTVYLDTRTGEFVALSLEKMAAEWLEENRLSYNKDIAATGE